MTITGQSSLDKDSINQMIKDAEAHAEDDRRRKEEAEVRNNADSLVYQTEKLLKDQGDKISPEERKTVEDRLADVRSALAGSDVEAIKTNTELLMNASQDFTQKLYQAAAAADAAGGAAGGGSAGGTSEAPDDDEVVDAEIVDDDEAS
jgi:molecular chaperone DnaK